MASPSIVDLPELIAELPTDLRTIAAHLLFVERVHGMAVPPSAMLPWVVQHFGSVDAVRAQTVVKVTNRLTLDAACYSPLRARRPKEHDGMNDQSDQELDALIAANTADQDMFRDPHHQTTADVFGRIQGRHCVSASNVAKCDGWHGVVIFDELHPLRFTQAQLCDYFDVALRWIATAYRTDPQARYPVIAWNCLWKSGASITHGHMQMIVARGMASGHVERWRQATVAYRERYDRVLLHDLYDLHAALGLAIQHDERVQSYVSLTPVKDREVVLTCALPPEHRDWSDAGEAALRSALVPLWQATATVLRHLIDQQGVRCFNVAVYLPPCGTPTEPWDDLPVCVRLVDRGPPLARTVTIGAMEMFASSIITVDPFEIAATLQMS